MITIYWHCLGMKIKDKKFLVAALQELALHLKEEPKDDPIKLPLSIKRLGDESDLIKGVNAILHKLTNPSYTFSRCVNETFALFDQLSVFDKTCPAQLLVYCSSDSPIALAAKSEAARMKAPPPCWGATAGVGGFLPTNGYKSRIDSEYLSFMRENFLCAVYPPKDQLNSKFTIWHEVLHLLGLDDCYDENTLRRNCNCETCVMQYEPPSGVDENWPSPLCDNICDKQKEKLREFAEKVEQRCGAKNNS